MINPPEQPFVQEKSGPLKAFAVNIEDITLEDLKSILLLYAQEAGGTEAERIKNDADYAAIRVPELLEAMKEEILIQGASSYGIRLGSQLNELSKLDVCRVYSHRIPTSSHGDKEYVQFVFNPNTSDEKARNEARTIGDKVGYAINSYIVKRGFGIELKPLEQPK